MRSDPSTEERRVVTVLFADLAGFTALAESLDPEDLRSIMTRFYAMVAAEVQRFGGTVEKYVGDAALAIFGLPDVHEDDAERAVRAALAMQHALTRLNEQLGREGVPALQMRIGVNTGEVVADPRGGALGEFHLAADAINVAARLQQHGEGGSVLIGPRTEGLVRGAMETIPIGPIALKGKTQPVPAWRVTGLRAERAQRGIPGREAPLIGRTGELELLLGIYDRVVRDREPHVVTILGVPGVGKSRLQQEATARLRALPSSPGILQGRCLAYGERAFSAIGDILRQDAQIMGGEPPEVAREKLHTAVARRLTADADRVAQALGFLIDLVFPDSPIAGYDPKSAREEAFHAWRRFLAGRTASEALVLVVEDIHWADDGLLDLLDYTVRRLDDAPVLLCCLARPELLERRPQWGSTRNASVVRLQPLTDDESRALITAVLNVDDLQEEIRAEIVRKSEGNPFFVEEIVRMLIEQGGIAMEADRWRATGRLGTITVPDTIQGVVAARLDGLPMLEKRTLQVAAVVGRTFWLTPVRALMDGDGNLDAALHALERRDLIRRHDDSSLGGDSEFVFKHIMIREVAYGTLPKAVRSPAHARIAAWFEETVGERADEVADLLAYHWKNGGDAQRAAVYFLRAGDRARRTFSNRHAAEAYTEALTLRGAALSDEQRARAQQCRGEVRQILGDYAGAQTDFEAALEVARQSDDQAWQARLSYEIARLHHRRLDRPIDEIIAGYEGARALAVEAGDRRTEGLCLTEIASARWDQAAIEEAKQLGHRALAVLQEVGDHAALAGVMNQLAMAYWIAFQPDDADRWLARALTEARLAGDRSREATALSYMGMYGQFVGRIDQAFEALQQADRVAEEIGDRRRRMWIRTFRAFLLTSLGCFDRAIEDHAVFLESSKALGLRVPGAEALGAAALLAAGDIARARSMVETATVSLEPNTAAPSVFGVRALLHWLDGDLAAGRQALADVPPLLERLTQADTVMTGGAWLPYVAFLVGNLLLAETLSARILTRASGRFPECTALAELALGLVATEAGHLDDAEQHLNAAYQVASAYPYLPARVEIALGLHRLRRAQGLATEAQAHLLEAETLIERIAAQLRDGQRRETFLLASPAVRRVRAARRALVEPSTP